MKRITLILCTLLAFCLISCGNKPDTPETTTSEEPTLKIVATEWSQENVSEEKEYVFSVAPAARCEIVNKLSLDITEVNDNSVKIKTEQDLCEKEDGKGINLLEPQTEFVIEKGRETILCTPTMDAGTTFYITFE